MRSQEIALLVTDKIHSNYNPLEELKQLVKTAGAQVVGGLSFDFSYPTPNYFIGKGQAEKLHQLSIEKHCDFIVVDCDLSSVQQRNLEKLTETRVIDRTQLILDIFAQHADSQEGKIQVELAQLRYLLPRLTGKGRELSRLGGGIGTKGPGEMKLEYDRRRIRKRITLLEQKIEKVSLHRQLHRKRRKESMIPQVVLVGYTNSGKTTLMNQLAHSDFPADNQLFLTLDSRMRRIDVGNNQNIILTDTVGFIRKLPHQLIATFKSTLDEVTYADILIKVIDGVSSDIEGDWQTVRTVLEELNALDKPIVTILNKEDLLTEEKRRECRRVFPEGIFISALKGENLDEIKAKILQILRSKREVPQLPTP